MSKVPAKMKALVIEADKVLTYKEIPVPELKADEVLVKVRACGICGSDIPRVLHGGTHFYPITVGHEFSGEVAKLGDNVKDVKLVERVTVAPLIPCSGLVSKAQWLNMWQFLRKILFPLPTM